MRKNFSKFLMNTAMFELSCDPCTAKLFTANRTTASKLLLRKRKLRSENACGVFSVPGSGSRRLRPRLWFIFQRIMLQCAA